MPSNYSFIIKSDKMKTLLLTVSLIATVFVQQSFAQGKTEGSQLPQLLSNYYDIKNALVAGNENLASARASEFIKTANNIDYKLISEGNINALLKDATSISESKDLKKQREYFANFSGNMILLAKSTKLGDAPIYEQYCPMKKASWLSSDKVIKNPYYGSAMLTCGNITGTIN